MRKINNILLHVIAALGLVATYMSIRCLNIILNQIVYLQKKIDNKSLYTIVIDDNPLIGFLKDFYVNVSIYGTIIKFLFIGMLVIGLAYAYCSYTRRKCEK